jgi:hypothetical protein
MKLRAIVLATLGVVLIAAPAFAGAGSSGSSSSSAGGSHASGSSSSSASVNTSGGGNVGVVQGTVAGGSSTSGESGSESGASNGGSSGGGQVAGAADAPNAVSDGVLRQLDLPAMGTAGKATPASARRTDAYTWLMAGAIVLGLALLYRRLPRPTRA